MILKKNKIIANYIPPSDKDNFSHKQVNGVDKWIKENQSLMNKNKKLLTQDEVQEQFFGYLYNPTTS